MPAVRAQAQIPARRSAGNKAGLYKLRSQYPVD
jgi:hypothetical protein